MHKVFAPLLTYIYNKMEDGKEFSICEIVDGGSFKPMAPTVTCVSDEHCTKLVQKMNEAARISNKTIRAVYKDSLK